MSADTGLTQLLQPHRLLLAERDQWLPGRVSTLGDAVLLARMSGGAEVLAVHGEAAGAIDLLDAEARLRHRTGAPAPRWLSAPRAAHVPPHILDGLGLTPATQWDWMSLDSEPIVTPEQERAVARVRVLERTGADLERTLEVLARANPISTADPLGASEVAWFGVAAEPEPPAPDHPSTPDDSAADDSAPDDSAADDSTALVGVVGARLAQGAGDGFSWHLHGLSVLPGLRRAGYGSALTIAAARAGLAAGAEWISLGLYADNDAARRIYTRLGFHLDAAMASYAPALLAR